MSLHKMPAHSAPGMNSGSTSLKEVFLKVSGYNPTVKSSSPNSDTVRQVPLAAILSPRRTSCRTVFARIFMSNPPSLKTTNCLTSPDSSTMPVKRDRTVKFRIWIWFWEWEWW
ncbi:hypothetical protein OWV82_002536 [Melia azedarach]|uniref:Uncharacterized protein n=1 Tax=Melia azedarach TaxID=155640 RepID=A0ACC1Z1G0_MELAZ|nr:hypothetical protein OWV82_002536 [Melia azedarach]